MRTIKRLSFPLNAQKKIVLTEMINAYAVEKQSWLSFFQEKSNIALIAYPREVRNKAVKTKYQSIAGLQSRMWKLALQDAADTMDRYWESVFKQIKRNIYRNKNLQEQEKYYAFWLLKDYGNLSEVLQWRYPDFKEIAFQHRKKIVNFIHRQIRRYKNNYPRVKLQRSFVLDADCYSIFEEKGRQYIKIMTVVPRNRLVIPLLGNTPIQGNIRVVLDKNKIEVHYTATLQSNKNLANNIIAVDFGYSEVMTTQDGEKYGKNFGETLTTASDALKIKMKKRHKLHALQKKYQVSKKPRCKKKAKNLLKYNLGSTKRNTQQLKIKSDIENQINRSFNILLQQKPSVVISEDLAHVFQYNLGRNWNRRLSSWTRGVLTERLEFKALAKGFSHEQVNSAYSSQLCFLCGCVDRKNRKGDIFQCQNCGHGDCADRVAATNLYSRYSDLEITRYTPYREVKQILLERFHRRLETEQSGTVRGRTLAPHLNESTVRGQSGSETTKCDNAYI